MIKKETKIKFLTKYINEHPDQKASEIYNHWKGKKHSIRKKDMLSLYHDVKDIPPVRDPSLYIPKKYRKKPVRRDVEVIEDLEEISDTDYAPYYRSLRMMISRKGRPQNKPDMEMMMYKSGFRKKGMSNLYPTGRQIQVAWDYLKRGK